MKSYNIFRYLCGNTYCGQESSNAHQKYRRLDQYPPFWHFLWNFVSWPYIGSSQSVVKAFRLRSVVSLTIQQTRFIRIGWSLGVPYSSLSLLLRFDSLRSDFCTQYYTFVHGFTIPNMNLIRQINWFHFTTIQISARCALPDLLSPTWSNIQFRLFCRAPDAISVSRLAATTESSTGRDGSTLRKQRFVCL